MEDRDEPNLRAESLRLGRDFQHGRGAGTKQQIVHHPRVVPTEGVPLMRQGEYDVEVGDAEEFFLSCGEPALASLCLALGTVPVPAGVIRDGLMTALRTLIDVAAQRGRPAASDRAQHTQLLVTQPGILFDEAITLLAEDIGHLHGRPAHCGLRSLRERGSWAELVVMI